MFYNLGASFNPTDIIQYCFQSLWVPFEDSYVLLKLFHFVSIWSILTQNEICSIAFLHMFHFASTMPTQNEIKNQNEKNHFIISFCVVSILLCVSNGPVTDEGNSSRSRVYELLR